MTVEDVLFRLRADNFGRAMKLIRENQRLREQIRRMQQELDRLEHRAAPPADTVETP